MPFCPSCGHQVEFGQVACAACQEKLPAPIAQAAAETQPAGGPKSAPPGWTKFTCCDGGVMLKYPADWKPVSPPVSEEAHLSCAGPDGHSLLELFVMQNDVLQGRDAIKVISDGIVGTLGQEHGHANGKVRSRRSVPFRTADFCERIVVSYTDQGLETVTDYFIVGKGGNAILLAMKVLSLDYDHRLPIFEQVMDSLDISWLPALRRPSADRKDPPMKASAPITSCVPLFLFNSQAVSANSSEMYGPYVHGKVLKALAASSPGNGGWRAYPETLQGCDGDLFESSQIGETPAVVALRRWLSEGKHAIQTDCLQPSFLANVKGERPLGYIPYALSIGPVPDASAKAADAWLKTSSVGYIGMLVLDATTRPKTIETELHLVTGLTISGGRVSGSLASPEDISAAGLVDPDNAAPPLSSPSPVPAPKAEAPLVMPTSPPPLAKPPVRAPMYAVIAYSPTLGDWGGWCQCTDKAFAEQKVIGFLPSKDAQVAVWVEDGFCALALGKDHSVWGIGWGRDADEAGIIAKTLEDCAKRTTGCYIAVALSAQRGALIKRSRSEAPKDGEGASLRDKVGLAFARIVALAVCLIAVEYFFELRDRFPWLSYYVPENTETLRKEKADLEGEWQAHEIRFTHERMVLPPPGSASEKHLLHFANDTATIFEPGKVVGVVLDPPNTISLNFAVRPSKKPSWVDVTVKSHTRKDILAITDTVYKGIYVLEGDRFKICLGSAGGRRPNDFHNPSEPAVVYEYRRGDRNAVRSPAEGRALSMPALGQRVTKGETLVVVQDTGGISHNVVAPRDGVVAGMVAGVGPGNIPEQTVRAGDVLIRLRDP